MVSARRGSHRSDPVTSFGSHGSVRRRLTATREQVFGVLGDGWLYPGWVVGAARMRDVDDSWPSPQARLHHSFGIWPALIDDQTVLLEWDPPRRAVLEARGWPLGTARVEITLTEHAGGSEVCIVEQPNRGPGVLVPPAVRNPLIALRNSETLRRLAFMAEGGAT
jgi:hypothetical protein